MIPASSQPSTQPSTQRQNLFRLLLIRYVVLLGQSSALLLFTWVHPIDLPVTALSALITLSAFITLVTHWRQRQTWPVGEGEFSVHLLIDITSLTALLYFSGGATNPFVSYYLVLVIIAAVTLSRKLSWMITAIAVAAYSLLFFFHIPIAGIAPHSHGGFNLHVLGMWFNFFISAALIVYFVVRMAETLRAQQVRLDQQRDQQAENEQLLAIATVAAGTAHELGTPLNTVKLLVENLLHASGREENEAPLSETARKDLQTADDQINLCRRTLEGLTGLAEDINQPLPLQPVNAYIDELLNTWQLLRPEIKTKATITEPQSAISARFHPVIRQALFNLFNNAADASPDLVSIDIEWNQQQLTLVISDRGPGLSAEQLEQLGRPMRSSKQGGLGLGLYLTHSSLNRHGGTVELLNRSGGGLQTRVVLNLADPQSSADFPATESPATYG